MSLASDGGVAANQLSFGVAGTPVVASDAAAVGSCFSGSHSPSCFSALSGGRVAVRSVSIGDAVPATPGNLAATVSADVVTLNWSPPTEGEQATSYVIEAGSSSWLTDLASVQTNSTATTFAASGVSAGAYYVRVKGQNRFGVGEASNEIVVIVGSSRCATTPGAPTSLSTLINGSSVYLSWTAATGSPTRYVVEAGSTSGSTNLANNELGPGTSYTALGVARGVYFVRVRARNNCGTSVGSNEVIVNVGSAPRLVVTGVGGQIQILRAESSYAVVGHIDVTVNSPVFGAIRMDVNSGAVVASQQFHTPTTTLTFPIRLVTSACPDFRSAFPLELYDEAANILASVRVQFRGTGCAS